MAGLSGLRVLELDGGLGIAHVVKLFVGLGSDQSRVENSDCSLRYRPYILNGWICIGKH